MTLSAETAKAGPYYCDGTQTVFPFFFNVRDTGHLSVYLDSAELDASQYQTILSGDGGSVTLNQPPPVGSRLAILRNVPFVQETDLQNHTAFYPEVIEGALDLAVMRDQQLREMLSRCIQLSATESDDATPESLRRELADAVAAADAARIEAEAAAARAGTAAAGVMSFTVPWPEDPDQLLVLHLEFSLSAGFTETVAVSSAEFPELFQTQDAADGSFEAAPAVGFSRNDAGKTVHFRPAEVTELTPGTVYFARYRWGDGVVFSAWDGTVFYYPGQDGEGGSGTPEPGATGISAADLPDAITGLRLAFDEETETITASPGHCRDTTGNTVIHAAAELSWSPVGLAPNSELPVYLLSGIGGVRLWAGAAALLYDVPWESPRMFSDTFPEGYAASASSLYAGYTAWRAFDRDDSTDTEHAWISAVTALPQHVQLTFDRPKKINYFYARNRSAYRKSKTVRFDVLQENGEWVSSGVTVELADAANSAQGGAPAEAILACGVRAVVTDTYNSSSGAYAALAEVRCSGFAARPDPDTPPQLPDGYTYFRRLGTLRTGPDGTVTGVDSHAAVGRIGINEGRVWLSEPLYPRKNSWIEVEHGLTIDPLRARAEVLAICVTPDKGYETGDFAVNLCGADSRFPLAPALGKTNVALYLNAALVAMNRGTGAAATLNPECWALYLRIFY